MQHRWSRRWWRLSMRRGPICPGRDRQGRGHHQGARCDAQSANYRRARRSWSPGGGVNQPNRLLRGPETFGLGVRRLLWPPWSWAKAEPGIESNLAIFQVRITNLIRGAAAVAGL